MARLKRSQEPTKPDSVPARAPRPVSVVPGALYGYCPKCSAPAEYRDKPSASGTWGKDRCQSGHTYPSMEAMPRPLVTVHVPANKKHLIQKRKRNK